MDAPSLTVFLLPRKRQGMRSLSANGACHTLNQQPKSLSFSSLFFFFHSQRLLARPIRFIQTLLGNAGKQDRGETRTRTITTWTPMTKDYIFIKKKKKKNCYHQWLFSFSWQTHDALHRKMDEEKRETRHISSSFLSLHNSLMTSATALCAAVE